MIASQQNVDKLLKEYNLGDDLYMTNPKANYSFFVSECLTNINDTDDIAANRDKIIKHL